MNHRCAEALAELNEVGAKFDLPQPRRCKMLLHSGDGHEPAVRILEMPAGFVRLNLAGALQQDARDDLETVCDTMLHFLQKDGLLAKQVVLELVACPGLGYVRNREQHAWAVFVVVVEFARIHNEEPWLLSVAIEVELVCLHLCYPGSRPFEQRTELWNVPFAVPQSGEAASRDASRVDLKGPAERSACGDDFQISIEEHQWRVR